MQRVSLVLDVAVTPEMSALAEELEEFCAICKKIDRLLSENKIVGAQRKLRALIKGVLASDSDQTSHYLSEIYERWGRLVDVDLYLEAHLADCTMSKCWVDLIRFKFRNDPAALAFIGEFESSCEQMDKQTYELDATYHIRNLIKSVSKCPYRSTFRRRGLDAHLLDAMRARYGGLMNIDRYLRKLQEAERTAKKEISVPFEELLENIRHKFRGDRIATGLILHVTLRVAYLECRLVKDDPAVGRAALVELVRTIVERCSGNGATSLRWQLLGLLSTQYRHVVDVRREAFRLIDEINLHPDAWRARG